MLKGQKTACHYLLKVHSFIYSKQLNNEEIETNEYNEAQDEIENVEDENIETTVDESLNIDDETNETETNDFVTGDVDNTEVDINKSEKSANSSKSEKLKLNIIDDKDVSIIEDRLISKPKNRRRK